MLGQVCEKQSDVESNVFGRIVETLCELQKVYFTVFISVNTHHDVVNLLSVDNKYEIQWITLEFLLLHFRQSLI